MTTTQEIKEIIERYAKANADAEQNSSIMCGNPSSKEVEECTDRMGVLGEAEDEMAKLHGRSDLPAELVEYFEATTAYNANDCSCHYAAFRKPGHEKCEEISHRWFRAREVLVSFGLGIPPRHDVTFDNTKQTISAGGVELSYKSPGERQNLIVPREEINAKFGPKTLEKFTKWEKQQAKRDRRIGLPKRNSSDPMSCDVMAFMRDQRKSLSE